MDSFFPGTAATSSTRRRAFAEEDEGPEAEFPEKRAFSPTFSRRKGSYRAVSSSFASAYCSPRSSALAHEEAHHFLDSCYLCSKPLGGNRDIFMYRGNTPFCSEECRQEQMDIDEAKEKNWNLSIKAASRKEQQQQQQQKSNSKGKNQDLRLRTGTVVAG